MIQRLLSGTTFTPETIVILTMAFEAAALELNIPPSDERARVGLAKLVLQIGAGDPDMDPEELTDKVTAAWEWGAKAPPPARGTARK